MHSEPQKMDFQHQLFTKKLKFDTKKGVFQHQLVDAQKMARHQVCTSRAPPPQAPKLAKRFKPARGLASNIITSAPNTSTSATSSSSSSSNSSRRRRSRSSNSSNSSNSSTVIVIVEVAMIRAEVDGWMDGWMDGMPGKCCLFGVSDLFLTCF